MTRLRFSKILAFVRHGGGNEVMVLGDLVLTEDEVNPVMKRLVENGVEITAIHNHLLRASPSTLYMHVSGQGEPGKLATILAGALGASRTALMSLLETAAVAGLYTRGEVGRWRGPFGDLNHAIVIAAFA